MRTVDVLIVEDNIKISRTHQAFVDKVPGFTVVGIANTIDEARLLIETLEPDLILLDVYFPESNGFEFLRELRQDEKKTDVILITAARDAEMLHNALQGGAFDYMIKPVFFERFRESLCNYRQYLDKLHALNELSQDDADQFFQTTPNLVCAGLKSTQELPKGIDAVTLEKIIGQLQHAGKEAVSATDLGKTIGVSRTTARKYLEYLVTTGMVGIDLDYGTKGRPERKYLFNPA